MSAHGIQQSPAGSPGARAGSPRWRGVPRFASGPAFIGAAAVWIATWLIAGHGFFGTLSIGVTVATFLVIVGIGQMFVITSGSGAIDLSVPYVMTLSAYLGTQVMNGDNGKLVAGLAAALLCGLVAAALNIILIEVVGIPPLVGTLAVGFVIQTVILVHSSSSNGVPSPALATFVNAKWGPLPVFGLLGIAVAVIFAVVLKRTSYGRRVEAVGQSDTAARLAGISPHRVRAVAYLISALMAALAGMFLAAYSGGASLDLGTPYQLASIAVVVLGGSLIAGGRSTVSGVWAAAVMLTILITLVNVTHASGGVQDILEGGLIVLVLAFASSPSRT